MPSSCYNRYAILPVFYFLFESSSSPIASYPSPVDSASKQFLDLVHFFPVLFRDLVRASSSLLGYSPACTVISFLMFCSSVHVSPFRSSAYNCSLAFHFYQRLFRTWPLLSKTVYLFLLLTFFTSSLFCLENCFPPPLLFLVSSNLFFRSQHSIISSEELRPPYNLTS